MLCPTAGRGQVVFFTLEQFVVIACLALAYLVCVFAFDHRRQGLLRHVPTLLGCLTFSVAALLAAKNLLMLLTTTKAVKVHLGRNQAWKFIVNPSDDPSLYVVGLLLQSATICLCLVLAYSVWSHRAVDDA